MLQIIYKTKQKGLKKTNCGKELSEAKAGDLPHNG